MATIPPLLLVALEMRSCFTVLPFVTFAVLVTSLVGQVHTATMIGMLTGAGPSRTWPHDRWAHDGSARHPAKIGYDNTWVIAAIVMCLPFLTRPVALPVTAWC